MIKKILVGTMLAALIGVLVYGAWYRTQAKAASESSNREAGLSAEIQLDDQDVAGQSQSGGYQANQSESGQLGENGGSQAAGSGDPQAEIGALVTLFGMVESAAEDTVVIQVPEQSPVELTGRALSFALEQGFELVPGNMAKVIGFYENEDFEIVEIENFDNGQTIALREQSGRPMWAGGRVRGNSEG